MQSKDINNKAVWWMNESLSYSHWRNEIDFDSDANIFSVCHDSAKLTAEKFLHGWNISAVNMTDICRQFKKWRWIDFQ